MRSASIHLDRSHFLAGWREPAGTLFVPTLSESRVGDTVALRIGIVGHAIRATLFGKVALVRRVGRPELPPGVELHLERNSLAAARFLATAARGEPVLFTERPARWAVRRTLHVAHGAIAREVRTANVSDGGCAVEWTAALPPLGDAVRVWLREGLLAPTVRGVVCWTQSGAAAERLVGLKLVTGGRGGRAWRALVEEAARSGAPAS